MSATVLNDQFPTPSAPSSMRQSSRGESGMSGRIEGKKRSNRVDFSGLAQFLRAEHPQKTARAVEDETGIPADTVKKWLSRESAPNGYALLTLALAYGPQVISACVNGAPRWLDAATRAEMAAKLEAEIQERERALKVLLRA